MIFTEHQVCYECGSLWRQETLRTKVTDFITFGILNHPLFLSFTPVDARSLVERVEAYPQWSLSWESDKINGMLGIFRAYSGATPPSYHVWGIPVSVGRLHTLPKPVHFLSGLCWNIYKTTTRRDGFPSFTWAGWNSPVIFSTPVEPPLDTIIVFFTDNESVSWDNSIDDLVKGETRITNASVMLYIHLDFSTAFRISRGKFKSERPRESKEGILLLCSSRGFAS